LLSFSAGNVTLENFLIVEGAAQKTTAQANQLRQLIGARAWILMAKVAVLEELTGKVARDDAATKVELRESRIARDAFARAYGADCSQVTGDAKIFKEQVDALRTGEIATLLDNINYHD
jgi:hypothetical protein